MQRVTTGENEPRKELLVQSQFTEQLKNSNQKNKIR